MPRQPEPITIPYFSTGLYTHRNPFFSPLRSVGVNVVTYHDAVIDGKNMELTSLLEWQRRPGFARFCAVKLGASEIPLEFYSIREPAGSVVSFVDTNQNFSTFTPTTLTSLLTKSTTDQGFIQQVGGITYYANGSDLIQWDGTTVTPWGIAAPTVAPTITSTGFGMFWQPNFTGTGRYTILDYNGNFQETTSLATTGSAVPLWNSTFLGLTTDNLTTWVNRGPYVGWANANAYILGTMIVDSNNNLEEVTTAGTSGGTNPAWATTIGGTTTDGGVTWTLRGLGFVNPVTPVGPKYPTTATSTGGGIAWSNPNNIKTPDGTGATVSFGSTGGASQNLNAIISSPSIPGGATIQGIKVEVSAKGAGYGLSGQIQLLKAGVPTGTIKGIPRTSFSGAYSTVVYGSSSDIWGTTLAPSDINSGAFGATMAVGNDIASLANVDFIRITIYYTGASGSTLGTGQISAYAGYYYAACYHETSGHVSTASPLTANTGTIIGQFSNTLAVPASPASNCDQVQFYRTYDGGGLLYLMGSVPNPGSGTVTFVDNFIPDANLTTTVLAPLNHLNDPPPQGTVMAYWQGRIFMAVGNKVYFNAGPDCTNGVPEEAWPPANVFQYPGPVVDLRATSQGLTVWGADFVKMVLGGPQTLSFYPYDLMSNFGISSPTALSQDGDTIWAFTSQEQAYMLNDTGKTDEGNYIADQIQDFDPTASYVTMHRDGQDQGVYFADGSANIYRLSLTVGSWSTVAQVVGGVGALRSIETSVGQYTLMAGRTTGGGYLLGRSLTTWQDDGQNYPDCYAVIGSITLAAPGAQCPPLHHVIGYFDAVGTLGPMIVNNQYVPGTTGGSSQPTLYILPNEVAASPGIGFILVPTINPEPPEGQTFPSATIQALDWAVNSVDSTLLSQFMHHVQVKFAFAPENAPNTIKALTLKTYPD